MPDYQSAQAVRPERRHMVHAVERTTTTALCGLGGMSTVRRHDFSELLPTCQKCKQALRAQAGAGR